MDRLFLLGLVLSMGMHTAVVARVSMPGMRGRGCLPPTGLELRYVEAVEMAPAVGPRGDTGAESAEVPGGNARAAELPAPTAAQAAAPERVQLVPAAVRGTGEVLRASVQETLRPLLAGGDSPDAAFSEAVRRYKTRLETILDRESRIAYPDPARARGSEARLQIRFSLRKDGSLESVELPPRCSGFERELVAGLRNAARHFPAFPEEIDCARLTFCWPVSFNLY